DPDEPIQESVRPQTLQPCAVYDLQGRKVADRETPETLRQNHPNLPKGVYIFGGRKVIVN
ncbi:MAG: T9SS type A sorting domain-containing protein, partial [Prevotella sp.]|nr:T9SS type A sorting domain-containing protein [Prevotella sp.]